MSTNDPATMTTTPTSVTIDRVFPTRPERLFQAWTDPALVQQWLAPGPMRCKVPIYEPRKGGRFRIEFSGQGPDGRPMSMSYEGTFDEVTPQRIVMLWPPAMPPGETGKAPPSVVTITFTPVPGGTRMRLTQGGMPNEEGAQNAGFGWTSAFEKLAGVV